MNNLNNIEEISDLLAENILSETILSKDNIKTKCKVFLIAWQRINQTPKKQNINQCIINDANSYSLLKAYIKNNFSSHLDKKIIDELMENFYKIDNLMK
jgi:hypothetical protein